MKRTVPFVLLGFGAGLLAAAALDVGKVFRSGDPGPADGSRAASGGSARNGVSEENFRALRREAEALRKDRDAAHALLEKKEAELKLLSGLSSRIEPAPAAPSAVARSPEAIRARLAGLPGEFDTAFQAGDGQRLLQLLEETGGLGPDAYPLLAEYATADERSWTA